MNFELYFEKTKKLHFEIINDILDVKNVQEKSELLYQCIPKNLEELEWFKISKDTIKSFGAAQRKEISTCIDPVVFKFLNTSLLDVALLYQVFTLLDDPRSTELLDWRL